MKNKVVIIGLIVIMIVGGFMGYKFYEAGIAKEAVTSYKSIIKEDYQSFKKEKNRTKKLNILEEMIQNSNQYLNSSNADASVKKEYKNMINKIKNNFKNDYNKIIKDNTIADVDTVMDQNVLNSSISNLKNLLVTIDEDKNVLTKKEVSKYENKINSLITTYTNKINGASNDNEEEKTNEDTVEKSKKEEKKNTSTTSSSNKSSNKKESSSSKSNNNHSSSKSNNNHSSSNSNRNDSTNSSTSNSNKNESNNSSNREEPKEDTTEDTSSDTKKDETSNSNDNESKNDSSNTDDVENTVEE